MTPRPGRRGSSSTSPANGMAGRSADRSLPRSASPRPSSTTLARSASRSCDSDRDGPPCGCGNRGCLAAYDRGDRMAAACGTSTPEEAIERARAGDVAALDGFARVGRWLGIGIGNMISVVTPDRVVIGGGLAVATDFMLDAIRAELRRHVFTTSLEAVEIVTAELGTWAGAIGAAVHGAEHATLTGAPVGR